MNKVEHCKQNAMIGWHNVFPFLTIYIHGFQMKGGVATHVYASIVDPDTTSYHKWRIYRNIRDKRYWMNTPLGRKYLDEFYRSGDVGEAYGMKKLR